MFLTTLLCGTFCFTSCVSSENGDISQKLEWITEPKMTTEYQQMLGWATTIKGIAHNVSGKKISYAQCSFSLYDKDNLNLGSAWTNVSNLAPDDKWNVEASYIGWTDNEPVKFAFNGFSQI